MNRCTKPHLTFCFRLARSQNSTKSSIALLKSVIKQSEEKVKRVQTAGNRTRSSNFKKNQIQVDTKSATDSPLPLYQVFDHNNSHIFVLNQMSYKKSLLLFVLDFSLTKTQHG